MVDDSNQTITQGSDPSVVQQVPAVDPAPAVPVDGATSGAQATIPASAPAQTQSTAPGGAPQKNPLDVLEQLLSEIDGGKPGSTPVPEKTGPTPEEIAAAELEKRRIEFEEKQAAQKIIDQQKIEEQRQILTQEMSTGVANVARAQQDEEKKVQEEEKASADEGYEILQIDHTKI
ncbi:hypothetical protein KA017_02430 [Candidatus Woesebacteria bacterium]|nr:hypothetical protein [Candidatus Woesebacteria bacterium]